KAPASTPARSIRTRPTARVTSPTGCRSATTESSTGSPKPDRSLAPAPVPASLDSAGTVRTTRDETTYAVRSEAERVPLTPVDAVSQLQRDALQQAARAQSQRVHEMRAPLPARRARTHRAPRRQGLVSRAGRGADLRGSARLHG